MKYLIFILICLLAFVGCHSGFDGNNGIDGQSCVVTTVAASIAPPNGGLQISCPGQAPAILLNGANGLDGTQITTVQFCPGTTVYPSTFNE